MDALAPRLYADLIGKPFVADARGPDAYDCVGLVCEMLRRCGFVCPDVLSNEGELHRQLAAGGVLDQASPLPHAEAGAVALLRSLGTAGFHVAVMLDAHRMIHASEPAGAVVIERLASSRWQRRVVGFYLLEAA